MKTIKVGQTKYYIESSDDMISLAHQLIRQGYTVSEIANVLGVSEKTVRKYLQDCW